MINLRIEEDGSHVEVIENGVSKWRHISTRELVHCLNSSIGERVEEESIASPLLPMGTIGYTIKLNESDSYDLVMFQQGIRTTLLFEDRHFDDVGLPSLVYQFKVTHKLVSVHIWAVRSDTTIRPDTVLHYCPVYNVDHKSHLCMGSNKVIISDPWELFKVPGMIQFMPSTHAFVCRNNSGLERDSLYKALQGRNFPDEWLTPAGITLGQILR